MDKLYVTDSNGRYQLTRPLCRRELVTLAGDLLESSFRTKGDEITKANQSAELFRLKIAAYEHEVFAIAFLDNRHRLIVFEEMFSGTIDGASVYPRVILQKALAVNAAALIVGHNHPSGVPAPSDSDKRITGRIKDALNLVDIRLLDHIIVAAEGNFSFAERGLI